jgi:hypothetical protein
MASLFVEFQKIAGGRPDRIRTRPTSAEVYWLLAVAELIFNKRLHLESKS